MVLTAYFVLSPATNSSCHRHPRIKVLLSPVGPTCLHELDTSNGCQDHTALPSAASICRQRAIDGSRETRPAITSARPMPPRPPHPVPNVRDDRETPLVSRDGMARVVNLIWVSREREYFCEQHWTASIRLIQFDKSAGARKGTQRRLPGQREFASR
jgi:hypothetical protein